MLSAAELDQLRDDFGEMLTDTCYIWRDVAAAGPFSAAGSTSAGTVAYGTVLCRVRPGFYPPFESVASGQVQAPTNWIVTMPHDTDIRSDDRITYQGRTLHPMAGLGTKTNDITKRVMCTEVNAGGQ